MTKINEIELIPVRTKKGLVFFASCNFTGGPLYLGNIAVYTRPDGSGFRCIFPTKTLSNGQQISIFHPLNSQVRKAIEQAISKEARKLLLSTDSDIQPVKGGGGHG